MLDTVGHLDVFSRLDALRTAVYGDSVKILHDTFLLKFPKREQRYGNGYAIRHQNRKDLVLIDTVNREHHGELVRFRESGYNIKGLLLTNKNLISQAYTELSDIARELKTEIYIHPLDSPVTNSIDITGYHDFLQDFDLTVFHTPGNTSGSVMIFSGASGALFTGDSAIGSPYEADEYFFERPPISKDESDLALRESWKSISVDFKHILPLHGKPQFDINLEKRKQILNNLIKTERTKYL